MAPITDAIKEGLRSSASEVKQGLETLSQQMGALFLTYFEKYKAQLDNNAADTREVVLQLASSVSLLTPLQDLAQPLKDLLKPIQDATGKMAEPATGGNTLKEALKPCLAALAATQRKIDEDAKQIVVKVGEQIDLLKASLLSAQKMDVKKITNFVESRVMTKLTGMTSISPSALAEWRPPKRSCSRC